MSFACFRKNIFAMVYIKIPNQFFTIRVFLFLVTIKIMFYTKSVHLREVIFSVLYDRNLGNLAMMHNILSTGDLYIAKKSKISSLKSIKTFNIYLHNFSVKEFVGKFFII